MRKMFAVLAVAGFVAAVGPVPGAAQEGERVRISGWALNMSNVATGANQTIQIDIDRWSTDSQRDHLIQTFMEKQQDGLLRELQNQPELGRWRFPGYMGPDPDNIFRLGTPLHYAMNHPGEDGGRRIVIATPRVMGFQEVRNQPRTVDYPFTLIEMRFDKSGQGEGRMAAFARINFDKNKKVIELENFSSEPVRLNRLRLETRK